MFGLVGMTTEIQRMVALENGEESGLDKLDTCEQFQQLEMERIISKVRKSEEGVGGGEGSVFTVLCGMG